MRILLSIIVTTFFLQYAKSNESNYSRFNDVECETLSNHQYELIIEVFDPTTRQFSKSCRINGSLPIQKSNKECFLHGTGSLFCDIDSRRYQTVVIGSMGQRMPSDLIDPSDITISISSSVADSISNGVFNDTDYFMSTTAQNDVDNFGSPFVLINYGLRNRVNPMYRLRLTVNQYSIVP